VTIQFSDPVTPQDIAKILERFTRPGVPKYTALRDAVVHAVASGRFAPGDRLPNEQELASVLPISLGTIQRGLRQLVDEGVLQRRHGQGSFIMGRVKDTEMSHPFHCRFIDDTGTNYLKVFPEAVGRRKLIAPGAWAHALHAKEGIEIRRRIMIEAEFGVFSSFIVDAKRLPLFAELPLGQLNGENFKDIIFRSCGQMVHRVDIFLRQLAVSEEIAEVIEVPAETLCTSMRSIAYLGENDPIYYQEIYIPPTMRELHIISDGRARGLA